MEDKIETIPESMEKFLGCSGKMVKPSPESVRSIVQKVKKGRLLTLDQLRNTLAKAFSVQTACPASTTKALQVLAHEDAPVCYWRIVTQKGALISKYPGGVEGHAKLLEHEGFEVDFSKKPPIVVDYKAKLSNHM